MRALLLIGCAAASAAALSPLVIWVSVLDDFGYSSASFNQAPGARTWETATPRMDAQAGAGVILSRAYSHSFCSPSRSAFFSGRLPVHVQQGNVQPDLPNAGVPAGC